MQSSDKQSKKSASGGRGGYRPGAGRPKGAANKRTLATIAATQDGMSPVDYLLSVMRDPEHEPKMRVAAATAAAPYLHAKLSSVELTGADGGPLQLQQVRRVIVDPKK